MRLNDLLEAIVHVEEIVDAIIASSDFDEHDQDAATSGLCGTFAITLHRELVNRKIENQIVLICLLDKNGQILKDKIGQPYWRHAAVRVGNSYFDVYGKSSLKDMIDEYCGSKGTAISVSFKDLTNILRMYNRRTSGYDSRYRNIWKQKLGPHHETD